MKCLFCGICNNCESHCQCVHWEPRESAECNPCRGEKPATVQIELSREDAENLYELCEGLKDECWDNMFFRKLSGIVKEALGET